MKSYDPFHRPTPILIGICRPKHCTYYPDHQHQWTETRVFRDPETHRITGGSAACLCGMDAMTVDLMTAP